MFRREYFFVMACWYLGTLAKAFAAYRIWRSGLIARLPMLWALLVALCVQGLALMALTQDPLRPARIYVWTSWIVLLLEGLTVVWIFRAVAENSPRFARPGAILLACLAVIGACACWMVGFLAPPPGWSKAWEIALLVQRDASLVMAAMLAGSRLLLPRISGFPIRQSVRRAADILTLYIVAAFASSTFTIGTRGRYPLLATLIPILNGLVFGVLCALWLARASAIGDEPAAAVWTHDASVRQSTLLPVDSVPEIGRILRRQ